MTSDADAAVLDAAWGHIAPARERTLGLGSFTRRRIERTIGLAAGLGSLVLGVQAFVASLGSTEATPGWHLALMIATFVPLTLMLLACAIGRGVHVFAGLFAMIYPITLILWPIATAGSTPDPTTEPWIWYLVNVATVAAVLAFPLALQVAWTVLIPLLFGVVRLVQGGFAPEFWIPVSLDVSFALILGGLLLTLAWLFRGIAANVDETRARAVDSYAAAAAADAAEQERIAVAALMHDSVLAALIAAERSHTPRERTLAVGMAREALTRLANTEMEAAEGSDEPREAGSIPDAIEAGARELGVEIQVERTIDRSTPLVPGRVVRALTLASLQAIANAVQHADGRGLAVVLRADVRPTRVRIEVRDTGSGFNLEGMPDDRLGIRASIVARVAAVGGTTRIASGERGTLVRLEWREPVA